jgi:hypothetical protein
MAEVFDTGFRRFSTFEDAANVYSNLEALVGDGFGDATGGTPNTTFTLSGINFNLPQRIEITGIEIRYRVKSNVNNVDTSQVFVRLGNDTSPVRTQLLTTDYTTHRYGGQRNKLGLSPTVGNINSIKVLLGIKQNFGVTGQVSFQGRPTPDNLPSIKVFYEVTGEAYTPGPHFISSNTDLTTIKFKGLGDRTSPLASPLQAEDLFGFTSTIVPEEDNSSQATDSVFGDAANFGKLGLNRGGGTGISSDTGLLDASKAPLSVRKGFRGL